MSRATQSRRRAVSPRALPDRHIATEAELTAAWEAGAPIRRLRMMAGTSRQRSAVADQLERFEQVGPNG